MSKLILKIVIVLVIVGICNITYGRNWSLTQRSVITKSKWNLSFITTISTIPKLPPITRQVTRITTKSTTMSQSGCSGGFCGLKRMFKWRR